MHVIVIIWTISLYKYTVVWLLIKMFLWGTKNSFWSLQLCYVKSNNKICIYNINIYIPVFTGLLFLLVDTIYLYKKYYIQQQPYLSLPLSFRRYDKFAYSLKIHVFLTGCPSCSLLQFAPALVNVKWTSHATQIRLGPVRNIIHYATEITYYAIRWNVIPHSVKMHYSSRSNYSCLWLWAVGLKSF